MTYFRVVRYFVMSKIDTFETKYPAGNKVQEYLNLEKNFVDPPEVKLELNTQPVEQRENVSPRDIAITTARQCYSSKKTIMKPRKSELDKSIANSTLEAGHHTTRMHSHFTWRIDGASRKVIHSILHDHPYYNTEQQSQRYVEAKEGSFLVPSYLNKEQTEHYVEAANYMNRSYFQMLEPLRLEAERRLIEVFSPRNEKALERVRTKAKKIAQEVARYALPIAQKSTLYYTLNHLQVLRMWRASEMEHFSDEAKYIVARMVQDLGNLHPDFYEELEMPLQEEDISSHFSGYEEYDYSRPGDREGTELIGKTENMRKVLADAFRYLHRKNIPEEDALNFLLDPRFNTNLADLYDVGIHDKNTQILQQAYFHYRTRLSHTADSQRQRHRKTPGSTPLVDTFNGIDYITPMIVRENKELKKAYDQMMSHIYEDIERALELGIRPEDALNLAPNGHALTVHESGDLFNLSHRLRQRLCFLAQEEIFFISVDQAKIILEELPEAGNLLQAPCGIRDVVGHTPKCPEGDRYCGVPVWKEPLEKYTEKRFV